jgi:GTP-binding protein
LTDTRGTGLLNRLFHSYGAYKGDLGGRRNGALISTDKGAAVAYAIFNLQDRGTMFVNPGDAVYQGMIVGEHNRENDLDINILKAKQLTNVRASGKDDALLLIPPKKMSLEELISYVGEDELLEVTPKNLRLRKKHLTPNARELAAKASKKAG